MSRFSFAATLALVGIAFASAPRAPTRELPLKDTLVDFGRVHEARRKPN